MEQTEYVEEVERLTVPIALVFTDMVGSSAAKRAASLGPDSSSRDRAYLANIQSRHLRSVRETLALYNGREIMTIGDSFFLTFEDPSTALECCAAIQKRLRDDPIQTPSGFLRLRIGLHIGTPEYFENSWHGSDVDLAARAESVGSAEQIIVTDAARRTIGDLDGIRMRRLGTYALKGVGDVVLWDADYDKAGLRHAAVLNNGQRRRRRLYDLTIVAIVLIALGLLMKSLRRDTRVPPEVSVLVADFQNKTGDPVFEKSLEQPIATALEGASFINIYNRSAAKKLVRQLTNGGADLDENAARMLSRREGIAYIVSGEVERKGSGFVLSTRTVNTVTGKVIEHDSVRAQARDEVVRDLPKLATRIRTALGDTTPASAQLNAAETYTTTSVEAAKAYAQAQDFQWSGNYPEAIAAYRQALKLDPKMGRAYSGLAVMEYNSGNKQVAATYFQQAMATIGRMSERERYRTRGGYYLLERDYPKAIDEYTQLLSKYPADSAGHANLALAYFYARDMDRALKEGIQSLSLAPNNVLQRNNVGLYAMYAGQFERAISEQDRVLELNPKFNLAFVGKAISELALGRPQTSATWDALSALNDAGASRAMLGKADLALYEGRLEDATALLRKGAEEDSSKKNRDEAAIKWANLAEAESYRHHAAAALGAADHATELSQDVGPRVLASLAYVESGAPAKANVIANSLGSELNVDARSYAHLIAGAALLESGKPIPAIAELREGQKIADVWLMHFYLGRAYLAAKAYTEADSEFDTCLRRTGEASALFLDEEPTFHIVPVVNYYDGLARLGMHSTSGVQALESFVAVRSRQQGDPLVADALRRLVKMVPGTVAEGMQPASHVQPVSIQNGREHHN